MGNRNLTNGMLRWVVESDLDVWVRVDMIVLVAGFDLRVEFSERYIFSIKFKHFVEFTNVHSNFAMQISISFEVIIIEAVQ